MHKCCLQRDSFLCVAGRCFQVCQGNQNIPGLLLRSFCCCRQGHSAQLSVSELILLLLSRYFGGVSPNIQVYVSFQALSSCWHQFPCHFRCFFIVLSSCVFHKWVVLWQLVAVVQSPLWGNFSRNTLMVSLEEPCTLVFPINS